MNFFTFYSSSFTDNIYPVMTIHEKFDEDPVFFRKFSELLEDAIRAFREQRLNDVQYLAKVMDIAESIVKKDIEGIPDKLKGNSTAAAIFRVVNEVVENAGIKDVDSVNTAIALEQIADKNAIVDWQFNEDAKKKMIGEMEDYLIDEVGVDYDNVDAIISEVMKIAARRFAR